MKILIIATENNKSKQLMHGISEQGYEFLDNPFKINEYENNWFDLSKYFKTNKFVVKTTTYQKPSSIPNYIVFISQLVNQFDKIILLDKIIEDSNKSKKKRHKEILRKISEMINIPITYYEKLFSVDNMEQFEIINRLELDVDSFTLQEYLDPNKNHSII